MFAQLEGYALEELAQLAKKLSLSVPKETRSDRSELIAKCANFVGVRRQNARRIAHRGHREISAYSVFRALWVKDSVPDASAQVASRYREMSVKLLERACRRRGLSSYTHTNPETQQRSHTVMRRPAARGCAGTLAQTFRR